MLNPEKFLKSIRAQGVEFSTGVPDSLLKDFCSVITDEGADIIAANEGGAIALAMGHHLATGKIPLVYMQNSGFGNCVNPLTSLADPDVYSIPMLLLIGWRGEPGVKDEPQHVKQGRISEELLQTMGIDYAVLSDDEKGAEEQLKVAFNTMNVTKAPFALLVKKGTFEKYKLQTKVENPYTINREEVIEWMLRKMEEEAVVVSTTGKSSREVFEIRAKYNMGHGKDFLTVGGMGHASQIALGIALSKKDRPVYCLDGDGATIMHMGSGAIIGNQSAANYKHILINNGCHESVGGQATVGFAIDFQKIAEASGYKQTWMVKEMAELPGIWEQFQNADGPVLLEIRTTEESRADLGRPTTTPVENKEAFMKNLSN
ncbi:phosphonopyruvate decarboxylase [Ekhidna lutea]|uniref:Phosphonopyruvate decarboxylase n=1 Tax=Ekhidna lutea TaxID=447679 RepID=A0A239FSG8_EKHLU|nr:phosphonopyruvate decarboxylase [Ekhidna lutea]SNS59810.1 phosphonopyruvate decarboxylase [Ekhidna lutea]